VDSLELTRRLLRFDTVNPPGNEEACARDLGAVLEAAGLACELIAFAPGRANLVARAAGSGAGLAPLVLTGHLDVVPLGDAPWARDPFAGEIADGRLHGRGASDMKSGVAAMACAAIAAARGPLRRGLTLLFTGGEEVGCEGAVHLCARHGARLGAASAMIVGEPTANVAVRGHKGALFTRAVARGVTAHSSMPERGVNAIYRAARGVTRIEALDLGPARDPFIGRPTVNVGTIRGGLNANSVPDRAEFTIDVRGGPEPAQDEVLDLLRRTLGEEIDAEPYIAMPAVLTAQDNPFLRLVAACAGGHEGAAAATYFSDASVFQPLFGCPTVILGPGEPATAHQTDEWCEVARIGEAQAIYEAVIAAWCA
jgi:succinyl-diaminopimelate desuccinylase